MDFWSDMVRQSNIAIFIVASEVGFWVMLAAGLAARYVVRWKRTSMVLLAAVPLLDVVLLGAVIFDLLHGADAGTIHGVAAFYLGVSLAFGPALVRWGDVRFAHRFAGGPPPRKLPRHGPEKLRAMWSEWLKVVLAAAISCAVLLFLILVIATPQQAGELWKWIPRAGLVTGIWLVAGPMYELFAGMGQRHDEAADSRSM
ncbi:hypothetical protein [Arthrobacter castelli]|uniref:hypothetical protein n=1 Tax=Arthrobacter castelli TaxID=271431 RepID=UPI0003F5A164|nr:hypothetical protein [Arthrobacter castelli]